MDQPDLFAEAKGPPGLSFTPALIGEDEEAALIAAIERLPLEPFRFQQWQGKRETASFGWSYDFAGGGLGPAPPIPDFLQPVREQAARFANLRADSLGQVLVTRYRGDAGIGWHRDRPVFGEVVGVSLGTAALLRLRLRHEGGFARATLALPPRSAYCLSGEARTRWEHSLLPSGETRWSLTFRTLAKRGNEPRK